MTIIPHPMYQLFFLQNNWEAGFVAPPSFHLLEGPGLAKGLHCPPPGKWVMSLRVSDYLPSVSCAPGTSSMIFKSSLPLLKKEEEKKQATFPHPPKKRHTNSYSC